MEKIDPVLHESWKKVLETEFSQEYFRQLKDFLLGEKKQYKVYPPGNVIFNALNRTPFDKVKVVILGQDPYHGPGQAHGLCFSVPSGIKPPPSLVNIFKELESDVEFKIPEHGNLEYWADQGVLLLNATLTVRAGQAGSHQGRGWEVFTDRIIRAISDRREGIVFLLWGRYAQNKSALIEQSRHYLLNAPHPSPLSAYAGFFGCRHFSKANGFLKQRGSTPIDWQLPLNP
jgi:uracil-DNA glycosylase